MIIERICAFFSNSLVALKRLSQLPELVLRELFANLMLSLISPNIKERIFHINIKRYVIIVHIKYSIFFKISIN